MVSRSETVKQAVLTEDSVNRKSKRFFRCEFDFGHFIMLRATF